MELRMLDGGSAALDGPAPERAELARTCRELEGMFLGVLVKAMWRTATPGEASMPGLGGGHFGWLWTEALGQEAAEGGGLGLAETLLERYAVATQGSAAGSSRPAAVPKR